ncbi:hypothetical protein CR205_03275 [Alteribacter lacisalsi]|uniref:Uncharacterized protein n=1 Tax=Alteribacter lacisalsi TaxID=2045244 RepID=A0A2W0HCA3_9BACI|nr:hypothetical protein [Alteribacter lacisalsi]PYZ97630.1 hypothetical protein CR205_03275 [Alteribacter lacisalsi]
MLWACAGETSTLPDEKPDDFAFSLQYGVMASNELNTFDDTFTKDLIDDGQETTRMLLSEEEMTQIYEEIKAAGVLDVADEMDGTRCSEPHNSYELVLQAEGEQYEKSWNTSCENKATAAWEAFMDFLETDIFQPRPEYQAMPETSGGYD